MNIIELVDSFMADTITIEDFIESTQNCPCANIIILLMAQDSGIYLANLKEYLTELKKEQWLKSKVLEVVNKNQNTIDRLAEYYKLKGV